MIFQTRIFFLNHGMVHFFLLAKRLKKFTLLPQNDCWWQENVFLISRPKNLFLAEKKLFFLAAFFFNTFFSCKKKSQAKKRYSLRQEKNVTRSRKHFLVITIIKNHKKDTNKTILGDDFYRENISVQCNRVLVPNIDTWRSHFYEIALWTSSRSRQNGQAQWKGAQGKVWNWREVITTR